MTVDLETPPHWLDQVLATATVGVLFPRRFRAPSSYIDNLDQVLASRRSPVLETVSVATETPTSLKVTINNSDLPKTSDIIRLTEETLSIQTSYIIEVSTEGYAFPAGLHIRRHAYTHLLRRLTDSISSLVQVMNVIEINRIGVVATIEGTLATMPPGIRQFRDHLASPWPSGLQTYDTKLLATIATQNGHWTERCHHQLAIYADPDEVVRLSLDWQRQLSPPLPIRGRGPAIAIEEASKDAQLYFSRFGAGELDYNGK